MKNNIKFIILLVGAILAGGAGWYLNQDYIDTQVKSYQKSFDEERQAIPVVVASTNLKPGDVITPQLAQVRNMPAAYVHKDAVGPARYESVLHGRPVVHAIRAGEPILPIHVSSAKIDGLSSLLDEGERAITISVDTLDTFSGFLKPGDNIDLYITLKDGDRDRTVPLVENIRVIATGKDMDDGVPEKKQRFSEITLGVSPLNATKIIHGQTVGDLAVLLRKPEDEQSEFQDYITIDNLVDVPQESAPEPQRRATWGFELIKGGHRS